MSDETSPILLWFRRDLRLSNNPALDAAAATGRQVIPVFLLRHWHDTFNARWSDVAALGFDERFRRMWNFYLTSCAATFQSGNCDVTQITLRRPA